MSDDRLTNIKAELAAGYMLPAFEVDWLISEVDRLRCTHEGEYGSHADALKECRAQGKLNESLQATNTRLQSALEEVERAAITQHTRLVSGGACPDSPVAAPWVSLCFLARRALAPNTDTEG